MKERPILFTGPMVRAILDGRKTMTRRVIKLTDSGRVKEPGSHRNWHLEDPDAAKACPYGVPGDRLWVRETWSPQPHLNAKAFYKATDPLVGCKWKPSIHMPRWASRINLEVTEVRVERVQDISEEDAKAEGVLCDFKPPQECRCKYGYLPLFQSLWESINRKRGYGWDTNPWVWVVEFKVI